MSFQISCMVLIPTVQQQIELGKWLVNIGRPATQYHSDQPRLLIAYANPIYSFWVYPEEQKREIVRCEYIDCGENVELFKALAAMNDDNDREQWFVADCWIRFARSKSGVQTESGALEIISGHWFKVKIPSRNNIMAKWQKYILPMLHKATKEEIIEHFTQLGYVRQQK